MNVNKNYDELLERADELGKLIGENEDLTDAEVDRLAEILDQDRDPTQDLPSNNGVLENTSSKNEIKSEKVVGTITGSGGVHTIPLAQAPNVVTEESVDNLINMKEEDISKLDIQREFLDEYVSTSFPDLKLSESDVNTLQLAVNRYKSGEKFQYFKSLPQAIQTQISRVANEGGMQRQASLSIMNAMKNNLAKDLFDVIISNNYQKTVFRDLSTFTNQELDKISKDHEESLKEFENMHQHKYEVEMIEMADKLEQEHPDDEEALEKAMMLRLCSHAFIQAYTYEEMYQAYAAGKIKIKPIMIDKFKKTCSDFNQKYYKSNFTIRDIGTTIPVLDKILPEKYNIVSIQKFIAAFISYTRLYTPSNIAQHVFMYFFIQNILLLQTTIGNQDFNDKVKENICKFLDLIIQKDEEKLKERNGKKNGKK